MKKLKMVAIIAAITCFTMLQYGCTKQTSITNSEESDILIANTLPQKISVFQERMRFESEKDFQNALSRVRSGGDINLNNFDASSNFKSYRALYNELVRDEAKEKLLLEHCIITPDGDSYNLVPFMDIASLLNSKLEIEIGGKIYKITRFGTYIINIDQYDKATALIDSLYKSGTSLSQNRKFSFESETSQTDYYSVAPGIIRLDTYKALETKKVKETAIAKKGAIKQSSSESFFTFSDTPPIPSSNIVHTGYTNDKIFNYFDNDSKNRMRANFSEYNWSFATFLGVEVTTQRKGWTGIWRELNAWETRIINNGVVLNRVPNYASPLVYDIPSNSPVGVPYYFYAPSISNVATAESHTAFGVNRSDGRVEYTFLYAAVSNSSTPTLTYALIKTPPGTGNKPTYTSMNVGCYVRIIDEWRGIVYLLQ